MGVTSPAPGAANPPQNATGWGGYFGNRGSWNALLHSRNCDPRPETTNRDQWQAGHSPREYTDCTPGLTSLRLMQRPPKAAGPKK